MTSLYQLTSDYRHLEQLIEDGRIDAAQATDTFDAIKDELRVKVPNAGKIVRKLEWDIKARQGEIEYMQEENRKSKKAIDSIKQRVMYAMEVADIKKINDAIMPTKIANNPLKANVVEKSDIPAYYFREKFEIDKNKLTADLKAGKTVKGAELTRGKSIRWG